MSNRATKKTTRKISRASSPTDAILKRRYHNHFLKTVIARADLATPISLPSALPRKLRAQTIRSFPIFSHHLNYETNIFDTPGIPDSLNHSVERRPHWRFQDQHNTAQIDIEPSSISITYHQYSSFSNLLHAFTGTINSVSTSLTEELIFKRLGLRYINQIELNEPDPTNWGKYLSERLLGIFQIADHQETISRAFHLLEFNYADMMMRFQYGMNNPEFPAPIKRKLFTLDYDAYYENLIEVTDIKGMLNKFHKKIKLSFEEVITNGLRDMMGSLE